MGTIAGAVTLYIFGYLIFEVATTDFYAANVGSATGVFRDPVLQWALFLGNISGAVLVTLGIMSRRGTPTIGEGAAIGAVIGFLVWFSGDFVLYGYSNVWNLTVTIIDPLIELIHHAIAGAVIAALLARIPKSLEA